MPYIIKFLFLMCNISRIEFYIFNLSFLFLIAALNFIGGTSLTSFISCMGVCFIILTLWLGVLIVNTTPSIKNKKEFALIIFLILLTLCSSFLVDNLLLYYIWFEISLIPIFIIILGWGYQPERILASIVMFFYTISASLPLLLCLIYLINSAGSLNYSCILLSDFNRRAGISLFLVLGFLVKLPCFGFHLWLPKAHVEAPVSGSIILAGVLLKLGGYGIIRLIRVTNIRIISSQIIALALIGGGILGVLCIVQRDIKVVIAYSSVVHIALVIAGRLRLTKWGFEGVLIIILAHGVCSSGIFAAANMIYERRHSRRFFFNSGLLNRRAIFRIVWFVLIVANFGGPFTYNLLGEILLILNLSSLTINSLSVILFLSFFSAAYRLILYRSTNQGQTGNNNSALIKVRFSEMIILISHRWRLLFLCIFMYMV